MNEQNFVNQIAKSMVSEMYKGYTIEDSVNTFEVSYDVLEAIEALHPEYFSEYRTVKAQYIQDYWDCKFNLIWKAKGEAMETYRKHMVTLAIIKAVKAVKESHKATRRDMASKAYTTFPICQCKGNASKGVFDSSKYYTAMLWLLKQCKASNEDVDFQFEDHTEEAYQNIESQRKETVAMNKSHMLYQSGSQSEESGQMLIGFVAIAIGAGAVAYGVYKVAEPLTTMLNNLP